MKHVISTVAQAAIEAAEGCGWLLCQACGRRIGLDASNITEYLAHGWPLCCMRTMTWLTPKEAKAKKRAEISA